MARSKAGPNCVLGMLVALCVAGGGPIVSALTVDFENPPYSTGGIVGQEGWVVAGYAATPNGTVEVSSASPFAGSQSLSYSRTNADLNSFSAADVVKTDVVVIAKDGTPAADLNASFLISSSSLSAEGFGFGLDGLYLSPDGANVSGILPIGIRLNNAGSTIPSIEELADLGGSPAFYFFGNTAATAEFPENDTLEFDIDVDFDSSTYTTAYRNVTTGGAFISSGFTRGFAYPYPANPDGTFDVDVVASFRFGAGKIDNITLTGNIIPEPTTLSLSALVLGVMGALRRGRR